MKKIIVALFLGLTASLYSQTIPQGINYQAIALDEDGQAIPGVDIVGRPIDGAEIGVRISILENSAGGQEVYQETHDVLTDLYGMFNLVIGDGLQMSATSFSDIDWNGDKYLKVELSVENDGNFKLSAIQQLMSVPYAFLAENALVAETVLNTDDADADPENEIQQVSLRGDTILLSNGGYVVLPPDQINDADADPNNEIQALTLSNDTVYLSNGGFIILPADQVNDADADSLNEIQTLTKVGDTISLSGGGSIQVFDGDYSNLDNTPSIPSKTSDLLNDSGYLNAEIDGSVTNELQTLSLSGDTLFLTDGGQVSTSSLGPEYTILSATTGGSGSGTTGWYISLEKDGVPQSDFFRVSAGAGIRLSGNNSTDYAITNLSNDMDSTNELQSLTLNGDTLLLSNGGFVVLPSAFDGSYSSLTGTPSIPTSTSDLVNNSGYLTSEQDGSATNELQNISKTGNTITLSDNGGSVTVFDGDYNDLTNAPVIPTKTSDLANDSGFITTEKDSSATNELQTLSISNDTLFLSNGGFVKLPSYITGTYTSSSDSYRDVFDEASGGITIQTGAIDSVTTILSNPSSVLIVKTSPSGSNLQYNALTSSVRLYNANGNPVEFYFEETFYRKTISGSTYGQNDDRIDFYYGNKTGALPTISRGFSYSPNARSSTVRYSQVKIITKEPVVLCRILFSNSNSNSNFVNSIVGNYTIQTIEHANSSAANGQSNSNTNSLIYTVDGF